MATLTAWKFDDATGADDAVAKLEQLVSQEAIDIDDAAVIRWPEGLAAAETVEHAAEEGKAGRFMQRLKRSGIDQAFVERFEGQVTPGTSALCVLSSGAVLDKVGAAFEDTKMELLESNLSDDQERELREAFEQESNLHLGPAVVSWKKR